MTDTVLVTEALLDQGKSKRGGWTKAQTGLLGLSWPLVRGWKRVVVGREIPRRDARRFVLLGVDTVASADEIEESRRLADRQITRREAARRKGEAAKGPDPDFTDEDLLRYAVKSLHLIARRRQPRWAVAMHLFGTGSTSASRLCLRFGFDPDSEIGPSEWELVERAVCGVDEELTVERWEEIFPGVDPPPEHERR